MNYPHQFNYLMDFTDILDLNVPFKTIEEHEIFLGISDHLINLPDILRPAQRWELHLKRGIIFLRLRQFIESNKEFNIAISINPDNYYQFLCRGCSSVYQGKLKDAYHDYIHGIFLNSFDPKSFLLKGKLELKMNNYYEAINTFEIIKNKFFHHDSAVNQATNHQMKAEELISKKQINFKKTNSIRYQIPVEISLEFNS